MKKKKRLVCGILTDPTPQTKHHKAFTGGESYNKKLAYTLESEENFDTVIQYIDIKKGYSYTQIFTLFNNMLRKNYTEYIIPSTLTLENTLSILFSTLVKYHKTTIILQAEDWQFGSFIFIKKMLYAYFLYGANRVIVCSKKLEKKVTTEFSVKQERLFVINPGINIAENNNNILLNQCLETWSSSPHKIKLLCISRIEKRKNIVELIHALSKVNFDFCLYIAGNKDKDINYSRLVSNLINDLKLEDKIKLLGHVSPDLLSTLNKEADLLIHTAQVEAFGMGMLESLAVGCPVICSEVITPEIRELPGVIFYKSDDFLHGKLNIILNKILKEENLTILKKKAESNKNYIKENWSWDNFSKNVTNVFNSEA